jgi:hypothetical protein
MTTRTVTRVAYADAWSRGLVRQWKTKLAHNYAIFNRVFSVYGNGNLWAATEDFTQKHSVKGRRRALDKLISSFGPGATLEQLRIEGKSPLAVWSILRPRESVATNALPESGMAQDGVCVNYILAGRIQGQPLLNEGLWTLEIPDHALGRAVEISRKQPDAIIADAHRNILALSTSAIRCGDCLDTDHHFLVKAGDGGFICHLQVFRHESKWEFNTLVRTRTWLSNDMLGDDQVVLVGNGAPGERLGDSWLLPTPMRKVRSDGKALSVQVLETW